MPVASDSLCKWTLMHLQSRRVNTSLVGKLLKTQEAARGKAGEAVSMLRMGCRRGRTLGPAGLAVLFLPCHTSLLTDDEDQRRVRQGGVADERGLEPVSPCRRAIRAAPQPEGAHQQPDLILHAFHLHLGWAACVGRYGPAQVWPGQERRRHQPGGGRTHVLWICKVCFSVPSTLCRLTLSFAPFLLIYVAHTRACFSYADMSYRLIT